MKRRLVHWAAIAVVIMVAYGGTLNYPFIYDDYDRIIKNAAIKDITNFGEILRDTGVRPVLSFTFALNYAIEGIETRYSYHIFNTLCHLATCLLLYELIRRLYGRAENLAPRKAAAPLSGERAALAGALLFAAHPLDTETVTYIASRSDGLSTVFYLATVLLFLRLRARDDRPPRQHALAVGGVFGMFLIAMATKEVAATLPLLLLILDAAYLRPEPAATGAAAKKLWKRWRARAIKYRDHAPFFFILFAGAAYRLWRLPIESERSPIPRGVVENLITQCEVVMRYIGLWFWPAGQNIAHDFPLVDDPLFDAAPLAIIAVLSWFVALPKLYRWQPFAALGVGWFWLTLLPSSSFVPLQETMSEHRAYLPALGLAMICGWAVARFAEWKPQPAAAESVAAPLLERKATALVALLTVVLVFATVQRNRLWADPLEMWSDSLAKSPSFWGAHYSVADFARERGEALRAQTAELDLRVRGALEAGNEAEAKRWMNEAAATRDQGVAFYEKAIHHYRETILLYFDNPDALINLGICLANTLSYDAAEKVWRRGLDNVMTWKKTGEMQHLDLDELRLKFTNNLARLYTLENKNDEAEELYLAVLRDDPANVLTHINIAALYEKTGRRVEALRHTELAYKSAPVWDPRRETIHQILEARRREFIVEESPAPPAPEQPASPPSVAAP